MLDHPDWQEQPNAKNESARSADCPHHRFFFPHAPDFGLSIPFLLAAHLVGTRVAHEWFGVNDSYTLIVLSIWLTPENTWRQIFLVGIHSGPAVVGRMGYGEAIHVTAIGDTVSVASRLQDLSKEYGCQLVISEEVAKRADVPVSAFPRHELTVRNRRKPLAIYVIDDAHAVVKEQRSGSSQ